MLTGWRKARLRKNALERRAKACRKQPDAGRALITQFPDAAWPAVHAVVAGYRPVRGEIDPAPLMETFLLEQAVLALPVVAEKAAPLQFRAYAPGDTLEARAYGIEEPEPRKPLVTPSLVLVPLVAIAVVAIGVTEQTSLKLLLPTAAVGVVGHLVLIGGSAVGIGPRFAPALAAVVIGLLARVVALRMGAPQLVVAVPAALILLPGLTIFRSMYVLTIEESEILMGAGGMLNAGAIVLGVAAGIVLGDTLARPLTRSLASNERRRARRR